MNKWLKKLKVKAILPAAALLAAAAIGTTFAWKKWDLGLVNQLKAHDTVVELHEDFDPGKAKENVYFTNTGSSSVFLRVCYTGYWEKDGTLLSNKVNGEAEGAVLSWPDDFERHWTACQDGWYYYNQSLKTGESTKQFLKEAVVNKAAVPKEYTGFSYHLYFKTEVVQCSDGSSTLNCDAVNRDAIKKIFGKAVTVGGRDLPKDSQTNLIWDEKEQRYFGTWPQ